MSLGGQTVKYVILTSGGVPGYLGLKGKTRTLIPRSGVHFRPFNTTETPQAETDVATEVWKLTDGPDAAALGLTSTSEVLYDGTDDPEDVEANRFQIQGPIQSKHDLSRPHHVTIFCKRQAG